MSRGFYQEAAWVITQGSSPPVVKRTLRDALVYADETVSPTRRKPVVWRSDMEGKSTMVGIQHDKGVFQDVHRQ